MDNLTDVQQVTTGFNFRLPRIANEYKWWDWYEGRLSTLLPNPTIDNGLKLFVIDDLIKWNPFGVFADSIRVATLSDPPILTSPSADMERWIEENFEYMFRIFQQGCEHWSVFDLSIFATFDNGSMDAIPDYEYMRAGRITDPDTAVGHVIIQPFVEQTVFVKNNPGMFHLPTQVSVTRYQPSATPPVNEKQLYYYTGTMDAGVIGAPVGGPEPAGILALSVIGRGRSWFGNAQQAVARLLIRLTNDDRALNRHYAAPVVMPASIYKPMQGVALSTDTPTQRLNKIKEGVNEILLADEAGFPPMFLRDDLPFESSEAIMDRLLLIVQLTSGSSPATSGFDIGKNQSGAAIERMQDPAAARARGWRWGLNIAIPDHMRALGAPDAPVSSTYFTSPFENRNARIELLIRLYEMTKDLPPEAQIITSAEVRAAVNLVPMDTTNAPNDSETAPEERNNA